MVDNVLLYSKKKLKRTPSEIANLIKSDEWEDVKKHDVRSFLKEVSPNYFVPNDELVIQVRPILYNKGYCDRQVTKIEQTKDMSGLRKGTLIFFPESAVINDKRIKAGEFRVGGGTHGNVIKSRVGIIESDYNIVNYKEDLGSDELALVEMCNVLNVVFNEDQGLQDDSAKIHLYKIMDKRNKEGKEPKPTKEQQDHLKSIYPTISQGKITNWIAHHKEFGGRRTPLKTYDEVELKTTKTTFNKMVAYENFAIVSPHQLSDFDNSGLAMICKLTKKQGKRKALIPLYATTTTQMDNLIAGKGKYSEDEVQEFYNEMSQWIGLDEIQAVILPWE